ncbi:MAG: two component transcriptional regulator, winged helix family [Pedosphaera sp.]|nr:two component transcriptional regulator, winged helix family [Pedosphaera sp.]
MAKRILIVDDEEYMLRFMHHHLVRAGYLTSTARNGLEAVAKATGEPPDLVILDLMMAEMDGLTALKELKRADITREIPVIVITANAHAVTRQDSESAGAAGFFTKPFSPTLLLVEIKRLLTEAVSAG